MKTRSSLLQWVEKLGSARILVIGDVMLDRYIYGDIVRISPEAPVPVLKHCDTRSVLGGAGNVVRNLAALGAHVTLVSIIGQDIEGEEIQNLLNEVHNVSSILIEESNRVSSIKTRYVSGRQQVLRLDRETTNAIKSTTVQQAIAEVEVAVDVSDVVLISDYGKGVLSAGMCHKIINCARKAGKPVFIDPKGSDYSRYTGATLLSPNLKELAEATQLPVGGDEEVVDAARKLISQHGVSAVLATRSQDGMSMIEATGGVTHLRAESKEVFDVSGAGDTVIATVAAAFSVGASLRDAADLANIAAGIAVGKVGTSVVHSKDLAHAVLHQELSIAEVRVLDRESALDRIDIWRRCGYTVGFTNGVFDLLHAGHIGLLTQAAKACDRLIVGINGDMSVRIIKGDDPVQHEGARSMILASLGCVDMVVIFQEESPSELLRVLRPDVLVKGSNYNLEEVVGASIVQEYGGKVVLVDITAWYDTNSKITAMTKLIL